MRLAYHLLDVFTERALAGNPLAVVPDADGLTSGQMLAIAREFNLSETVFVTTPRDPVHSAGLRIFTPALELPFAGHPTIGAACLIALLRAPDMIGREPLRVVLEEAVGPVVCEVARLRGVLRAEFVAPQLPALSGALDDCAAIAGALGLLESDIGFDAHRPVLASGGVPFAFVPVKSLSSLDRATADVSRFPAAFGLERAAAFVYSRETADPANHVQARVFVPGLGVHEDAATGAAACAFAAVAVHFERPTDGDHTIVIEQGFSIGRPSHIALTMRVSAGALVEAAVGGACVRVGEGVLTL
jgi:trans-2,3-dihydro-3-hydroxyanthranilate isomerase